MKSKHPFQPQPLPPLASIAPICELTSSINTLIPSTPTLTPSTSPPAPLNLLWSVLEELYEAYDFFGSFNYVQNFSFIKAFNFFNKVIGTKCVFLAKLWHGVWALSMDKIWGVWEFLWECVFVNFCNGQILGCLGIFVSFAVVKFWGACVFFVRFVGGQNRKMLMKKRLLVVFFFVIWNWLEEEEKKNQWRNHKWPTID